MAPQDRDDFVARLNEQLRTEHDDKQKMWTGIYSAFSGLIGKGGK